MRALAASASALALAGCSAFESSQLKQCESTLLSELKSPSSYKRISAREEKLPAYGKAAAYYSVTIEYDADNSYGAAIRDTRFCAYHIDAQGHATLTDVDPYANVTDNMVEATDAAIMATDKAVDAAIENSTTPVGNPYGEADETDDYGASSEEVDQPSRDDGPTTTADSTVNADIDQNDVGGE